MAVLNEHIQHIKEVLSHGIPSDDTRMSDRHIYHILKYLRAKKIKEKAERNTLLSPFLYQAIDCFPIEIAQPHDCGCIDTGCRVLKSTEDLPRYFTVRNRDLVEVRTMFGDKIDYIPITKAKNRKYRRVQGNGMYWYIHNKKLVVVDPNNALERVSVEGIFQDPVELASITSCGTETSCYDVFTSDFPMDESLVADVMSMTYQELYKIMMTVPADTSNNAADDLTLTQRGNRNV
jgi:hypothetical protein